MTGLTYIIETALLLLVAFLLGCGLGYALRRFAPQRRGARATSSVPPDSPAEVTPLQTESAPPGLPAEQKEAASVDATSARAQRSRPPADPRPAALDTPRDGFKDDLKQIKGIGPRIEASLNELGIFHFSQIARWSKKNAAWLDEHLAFKGRIERENWIEQAKALSKAATPTARKRDRSKT
ncbi:hypothetical protein [Devosia nitrariae]|uniref:Flap endonuclease-1-like 5' DNA nuclease n=1 Tax=Devosia nitrariae TaxID=2071872 RepID=A0ABQ5W833_9HYPH|nr:hypothetical protein [Devosia nitrariae]GLQ56255.1 hypothetical protein GCM10010862_35140 [Devosia nitrariae]